MPKCNVGDSQCIKESTGLILSKYADGFPGINLLPLDPISISKIDIVNGNQGPVNLKLFFSNAKLYGAKDAVLNSIRYVIIAAQSNLSPSHLINRLSPNLRAAASRVTRPV